MARSACGLIVLALACAPEQARDDEWPRWLSDVAIDPEGADEPQGMGLAYDVAHPLWTGGTAKRRVLRLPEGTTIDVSSPDAWRFPAGTIACKTLLDGERPLETRVIRIGEGGAEYEVYAWSADGSDAERLDLEAPTDVGGHEVPSRLQCRQCHEAGGSALLGIGALQLGDAGELDDLAALGLFSATLPADRSTAMHPDPARARVLGWLAGNCVHCHNGGAAENASFDLRPEVAAANLVDRPTQSSASAAGVRVVPGDPDASVLYLAAAGTSRDVDAMPPVGPLAPPEVLADLRAWIEALP